MRDNNNFFDKEFFNKYYNQNPLKVDIKEIEGYRDGDYDLRVAAEAVHKNSVEINKFFAGDLIQDVVLAILHKDIAEFRGKEMASLDRSAVIEDKEKLDKKIKDQKLVVEQYLSKFNNYDEFEGQYNKWQKYSQRITDIDYKIEDQRSLVNKWEVELAELESGKIRDLIDRKNQLLFPDDKEKVLPPELLSLTENELYRLQNNKGLERYTTNKGYTFPQVRSALNMHGSENLSELFGLIAELKECKNKRSSLIDNISDYKEEIEKSEKVKKSLIAASKEKFSDAEQKFYGIMTKNDTPSDQLKQYFIARNKLSLAITKYKKLYDHFSARFQQEETSKSDVSESSYTPSLAVSSQRSASEISSFSSDREVPKSPSVSSEHTESASDNQKSSSENASFSLRDLEFHDVASNKTLKQLQDDVVKKYKEKREFKLGSSLIVSFDKLEKEVLNIDQSVREKTKNIQTKTSIYTAYLKEAQNKGAMDHLSADQKIMAEGLLLAPEIQDVKSNGPPGHTPANMHTSPKRNR